MTLISTSVWHATGLLAAALARAARRAEGFPDAHVLGAPWSEKKGVAVGTPVRAQIQKLAD
jgi:hypothetical protein